MQKINLNLLKYKDPETNEFKQLYVFGGGGSGESGATFFPEVSEDGIISWTNDKNLENPEPVSIKGNNGDPGVGVTKVVMKQYLSTSKETPTGGAGKDKVEGEVGKYIGRKMVVTLSDGKTIDSEPFVDTYWEVVVGRFG